MDIMSVYNSNRLGFWILGLTNNFAYVIMLTAAFDLLKALPNVSSTLNDSPSANLTLVNSSLTEDSFCNPISTSAILLADTIPSLTIKLIYPFVFVDWPMQIRVILVASMSATSFLLTGIFNQKFPIFLGVVFASISSGLGEATYLSSTPKYNDGSLSAWSSGTGAAGLLGALSYSLLTMFLTTRMIMYVMLVIPIAMCYAYWCLLRENEFDENRKRLRVLDQNNQSAINKDYGTNADGNQPDIAIVGATTSVDATSVPNSSISGEICHSRQRILPIREKIQLIPGLFKYFMPLTLVYYAEYFINQGLFELVYFPSITRLPHASQYRWFQVCYQLGVMISRSSLGYIRLKRIWLMAFLQFLNMALFLGHTTKILMLPSFYLTIMIIIYEGLLGGFAYVNTFHRVSTEIKYDVRSFCLSVVTMADSLGIVTAGFSAIPVHNAICAAFYKNA